HFDSIKKTLRRRHASFFVSTRTPPAFEELSRSRLTKIMRQRREHHGNFSRMRKILDQLTRAIDRKLRVHKHITLRMPLGILRHANQTLNLRKQLLGRAQPPQPLNPNRWTRRLQQQ